MKHWLAICVPLFLLALYKPVHDWLHLHAISFIAGFFIGTLTQSVAWIRDRWLWMKHFSWN